MEKYRTARCLIILSLVTSLHERQRHNKDGKLQFKKIDELMKTWWIIIDRNTRKDFRVPL